MIILVKIYKLYQFFVIYIDITNIIMNCLNMIEYKN